MRTTMIGLFTVMLCSFCRISSAQDWHGIDGTWLKQGIDAFNRLATAQVRDREDMHRSEVFFAYVGGVLAVHRQNNLKASILIHVANQGEEHSQDRRVGTALFFAPLLKVPDKLSSEQVVSVLNKYLEANPGKWSNSPNVIIEEAFKDAFD